MDFSKTKRPARQQVIDMIRKVPYNKKKLETLAGKEYTNWMDEQIDNYYEKWSELHLPKAKLNADQEEQKKACKFDDDEFDEELEEELAQERYIKKRIYHNKYYQENLKEKIVCPDCAKVFTKKNIRRHERSTYHTKRMNKDEEEEE